MAIQRPSSQRLNGVVLVLNAGSSSLKFGLFEYSNDGSGPGQIALGVARPGTEGVYRVKIVDSGGNSLIDEAWQGTTVDELVPTLMDWIEQRSSFGKVAAVGHRIVHSGPEFCGPTEIKGDILERLEGLIPLAPLHQPACLRPIQLICRLRPELRQVACFDTTFHRGIKPPASRYALPRKFEAQGIRHYGFHGLSFESIAAQLLENEGPTVRNERIIVAHLGNGASLCALRDLQSVDTTMGFSTLDGLVMGTRPGAVDPGILLYLMKERDMSAGALEQLLYRQSGLLGVSGISSEVDVLIASDAPTAREALDSFAFQVARQTAALAATLSGLDRFVFTGGIGENAAIVRRMIVDRLTLFGAKLDPDANAAGDTVISSDDSPVLIEKRPAQEELAIARHVHASLQM